MELCALSQPWMLRFAKMNFTGGGNAAGMETGIRPMSNNDFPKWPKINLPRPLFQPLFAAYSVPDLRVSNEREARDASFEERLTAEDKVFLQAVGVASASQ